MTPEATRAAEALGLDATRRHIFICVKSSEQACCGGELAEKSWEHLKTRLIEALQATFSPRGIVLRAAPTTPTILAVGGSSREISLAGLPARYPISRGDLVSFSYGASPTFIKDSDQYAHGLNERVPLSNLAPSIRYYLSLFSDLSK